MRIALVLTMLVALPLALGACGNDDPDPTTVLDRALSRSNLAQFAAGQGEAGQGEREAGMVAVQALGHQDRVLDERRVAAGPRVMSELTQALGSGSGLRKLVDNLAYDGVTTTGGTATDHISGQLDVAGMARALKDAGGDEVGSLAGIDGPPDLEKSLHSADFDLFAGQEDGVIRRLDLTLALDDPDNALPPTRIRFSLTPDVSGNPID